MARKDPFAGLRLSTLSDPHQAADSGSRPRLDQQLFGQPAKRHARETPHQPAAAPAPSPPPPASPVAPIPPADQPATSLPATGTPALPPPADPIRPAAAQPPPHPATRLVPASLAQPHFELGEEALYKNSFVFTQAEEEALEDLKLELRRQLDTKVTKNDLIRSAVHLLVEDYAAKGEHSYVAKKLKKERA